MATGWRMVERTKTERFSQLFRIIPGGIAGFYGRPTSPSAGQTKPYATPTHKDARCAVHHVSRANARTYTCSVDGTGGLESGRESRTGS